jgi:putative ABC transport system substrate-binding protein
MKRRTFIAGLGSAAAWPVVARAQQADRVRRIGMLFPGDENDPEDKFRLSAFTQALADLGWIDGRNVRMDLRWYGDDINRIRALAQELVRLQPDIILTYGTRATVAVQRETQTIPIVAAGFGDPVASGIVARLDRPSGNITGFATLEASVRGKWLELLSEIAPGLKRAAIVFNPDTFPVAAYMPSLETAARSLKVMPIIAHVHSDVEIETAIVALGREPGGGLVTLSDASVYERSADSRCARFRTLPDRASRADHIGGGPKQSTGGLSAISFCQRRRFALLRSRPSRELASSRHLCRSHFTGREAGRSPGAASDKI